MGHAGRPAPMEAEMAHALGKVWRGFMQTPAWTRLLIMRGDRRRRPEWAFSPMGDRLGARGSEPLTSSDFRNRLQRPAP